MTRPSLLGRFFGKPFVALLMFVVYGVIFYGWYEGQVTWWVGLCTAAVAINTLSAVSYLRRYKAWRREYDAMGATPQPRSPRRRWFLLTVCVMILLAAALSTTPQAQNAIPSDIRHNAALPLVVLAAAAYVAFRVVRGWWRRRRLRARRKKEEKAAATGPMVWELGRPSDSPSREDAEKNLPEYAAQLLVQSRALPQSAQKQLPSGSR